MNQDLFTGGLFAARFRKTFGIGALSTFYA